MVGGLLLRGMLVGIVAGLLCFAFLRVVGERPIDQAIAFEAHLEEAKAHAAGHAPARDGPARHRRRRAIPNWSAVRSRRASASSPAS